jgi:hypothetical protein
VKIRSRAAPLMLAAVLCWLPQCDAAPQREGNEINENDMKLGKQLRAEIEQVYAERKAAGSLKSMGRGRNIVTDMVVKYIPIGISFDEAEAILRAAGCKVGPRPNTGHDTLAYDDDVIARLFLASSFLVSATEFFVGLSPKSVGDYGTVDKLEADIVITFL